MAEASVSEEQFICAVCLDVLKDPVAIPCGHNYCMSCITDCWDQEDQKRDYGESIVYSCPQCRNTFSPRPSLAKNTMLAEVVEKLKKTKVQQTKLKAAVPASPGDVECDVCTGRKHKAVKSCLVCLESYCQTHFERHEEFRSGKPHKVTDATGRLQQMICHQHDMPRLVFCRTDQQSICMLCAMDEHKNHDTVSTAAERAEKEKHLKETQRIIQQRIQQRQKDLQQLRDAVESHKRSAQTAVKDSERIFTELIRSIERSRFEVTERIRDQEKAAVSRAEGQLEQLKQEIDDLKRRNTELEQLSHTDDHIHFLQIICRFFCVMYSCSLQSLSAPPESTDNISVSFLFSFDGVKESVCQLKQKLEDFCKEEMKNISVTHSNIVPRTRDDFLHYSHQLTLDPNTVHKNLCLSEGNRVATFTYTLQPHPDHPDRLMDVFRCCVDRVYGCCYWEVEWSGSRGVGISLSYEKISRKGIEDECEFGFNDHSWCLSCSSSSFSFWHNNKKTKLPVPSSSRRIGVYVDHSAGTLSFYNVSDSMSLIHSIQTTFTQPLYPGFVVCRQSSAKLLM